MVFDTKNPTLKNIINFLRNLGGLDTDADSDNKSYGRKNGNWSEVAPINSPAFTGTPTISTTPLISATTQIANVDYVNTEVEKREVLVYTVTYGASDNTQTYDSNTNPSISKLTSDYVAIAINVATPSVQTGDWTVSTTTGQFTISGNVSGSSEVTLYFMKANNV